MRGARAERPRSPIGRLLVGTVALSAALILALTFSVLVEWAGLTFLWADEGAARSAEVLRQDIAWLRGTVRGSVGAELFAVPPWAAGFAEDASGLYRDFMLWAGIGWMVEKLASLSTLAVTYLLAALNSMQIFLVRVAIVLSALPLFLIFVWWGAMEGLVRRDLRRFGGDIEHGMVYHFTKRLAGATVAVPVLLYLAWPDSINPAWLFLPCAIALGAFCVVLVANFTKYV